MNLSSFVKSCIYHANRCINKKPINLYLENYINKDFCKKDLDLLLQNQCNNNYIYQTKLNAFSIESNYLLNNEFNLKSCSDLFFRFHIDLNNLADNTSILKLNLLLHYMLTQNEELALVNYTINNISLNDININKIINLEKINNQIDLYDYVIQYKPSTSKKEQQELYNKFKTVLALK